jgi:outer membrane protein assembly factor BamB
MARLARLCLTLSLLGGLTSVALAGNWERFRGPNGTGTIDDKDVPVTFGASENLLWQVPINGTGNGSPVVWGKHVFVHAASPDAKERRLMCFDADTGKLRWQKSIPGAPISLSRKDTSHASSTPVTDGEAVYVSFWDGKDIILHAYDFKGEPLWHKNLGRFISQHGAGASPVLYRDKLIFANDMDGYTESKDKKRKPVPVDHPSLLIALDKKTGNMLWETPRTAERACYSAPFLLEKRGQTGPDLVIVSTTAVTGYNPADGTKKWEAKNWQGNLVRMPLRTVASSALVGDVLIACSGDGAGDRFAMALELPAAGKTDAPVPLWKNNKDFPYVPCPLSRGEHFYFVNDAGFAGCYDAKTGKRIWFERLAPAPMYASPLLINGNVYATNGDGDVFVFAAEPTYRLVARNELGDRVKATPAVADGRIYFRGERNLFCFGKSK